MKNIKHVYEQRKKLTTPFGARHSRRGRCMLLAFVICFLVIASGVLYFDLEIFKVRAEETSKIKLDMRDAGLSIKTSLMSSDFAKDMRSKIKDKLQTSEKILQAIPRSSVDGTMKLERESKEENVLIAVTAEPTVGRKWPHPLVCTKANIPENWTATPLVLNDLVNFCTNKFRCSLPSKVKKRKLAEKDAIMKPIRMERFRAALDKLDPMGGTVILTLLNFAYAFLFSNFVCGCEKRGIKIRDSMLVITTDQQGYNLAKKMGFVAVHTDWVTETFKINMEAPPTFSQGDYF
jgi:hypothetical protein